MNFLNEMRALAVSLYGGGYANEVLLKTNYIAREIEDAKFESNVEIIRNSENSVFYSYPNGGQCAAYVNKDENILVIAFAGTNPADVSDLQADLELMNGKIPRAQFLDCLSFYSSVLLSSISAGKTIILVGHSLGGAMAQLVTIESKRNYQVYAFNTIGIKQALANGGYSVYASYSNIHNYCFMNDWFGMMGEHIGNLNVLPLVKMSTGDFPACIQATHNTPFFKTVDFSKVKAKPAGFCESEALSLWYYDYEIKPNPVSGILSSIINKIKTRVTIQSLENAIKILRNNPEFIEHDLKYKANGKFYYVPKANGKTIAGTTKAEVLFGSSNDDILQGNSGNDEIYGFEGDDTIKGGSGNDILCAGDGNDTLYGDAGRDVLFAESGDNKLYGGSGHDNLHDAPGRNLLSGGTGYDIYHTGRYSGGAIISDSDGNGVINYDGIFLGKADRFPNEEYKWIDNFGNIFEYISSNLVINKNVTIRSFKNGDLAINLYKENGEREPLIPGGNNPNEGEGGEGSGGGDGSVIGSGKGTGESNFDHDDEGNLIDGENPEEGGGVPPIGGQLGPEPGGGVDKVPPTVGDNNNPPVDPLIFDLDFNNTISLSKPENGRNFDIDNDGIAQKVA